MDNLVGVQEIADMLGVDRSAVHKWRERHADFPQPVAKLGGIGLRRTFLVWNRPDVLAWAKATGRWPVKADLD